MTIFRLDAEANKYEGVVAVNDADASIFEDFDGRPLKAGWRSPVMRPFGSEIHGTQNEKELAVGDFPASYFSSVPVFSRHAVDELGSLLTDAGELLLLNCSGREYYAYNVTNLVEALDEDKSTVKRFRADGQIYRIVKHCFRQDCLAGVHVFKLPQVRMSDVYVDGEFADQVAKSGLRGFIFEEL